MAFLGFVYGTIFVPQFVFVAQVEHSKGLFYGPELL